MSMEKRIGRTVEIIYLDRKGQFTQRRIRIKSVRDGKVLAYDIGKQSLRTFDLNRIYSEMSVMRHA